MITETLSNNKLSLSEAEARLKESLIIIEVMYLDMVKAGLLKTRSCAIAGRFLHSQQYQHLAEKLDRKNQ